MDQFWSNYSQSIAEALGSVIAADQAGNELDIEHAFDLLCEWTIPLRDSDGTLHFAGNGASACMASHLAVDWTKKCRRARAGLQRRGVFDGHRQRFELRPGLRPAAGLVWACR